MSSVKRWDATVLGPMTEAAIRARHQPASEHRVSLYRYDAAVVVDGTSRAGLCYVLEGSGVKTFALPVTLTAGDVWSFDAGDWRLEVGAHGLVCVHVWNLPAGFAAAGFPWPGGN